MAVSLVEAKKVKYCKHMHFHEMVAFRGVSFCGASKARMLNLLFLQLSKCFSLEDLAIHLFKKGSVKTI